MGSLIFWVVIYLLMTIAIGIYAARRVKTDTDYILAGRQLPLYIVIATTFATWFWSETVLWTSSTFIDEGLAGILADPFWAWFCLILVGLFFAKPFYKLGINTIGDFYRLKYGRVVEVLASTAIILSYIGWVSAQVVALWLVFEILTTGTSFDAVSQLQWSLIGGLIVLVYTFFGGMWSVALTDFFQMILIVLGMAVAAYFILYVDTSIGVTWVVGEASAQWKLDIFPGWLTLAALIWVLSSFLTLALGSIPQQDVFQRVLSANNAKNAKIGGIAWGSLYILVAFLPIFLGFAAYLAHGDLITRFAEDTQYVLPTLILEKTPLFVQVLFFGALLSAIMSTVSATLLAPSALFTENILKPMLPHLGHKKLLWLTRFSVIGFFIIVILFVSYKYINEEANIFAMVENAYKVTLAGALVPLVAWVWCKKVHSLSALLSMFAWVGAWIMLEYAFGMETVFLLPPHFFGFFVAIIAFMWGQMMYKHYEKTA
jgi:solute:Na+ symporter, SSS family